MIIGLTGGIGSGKSTVARAFGELGAGWVDADDIAREVVMPGEPALAAITQRFGQQILDADGGLNRAALRQIVFSDPEQRRWLESETHPRIRERLQLRLKELALNSPYVLLVSPLLFESGQDALAQRTLVVDVPEALQLSRTLARDGVSEAQVRAILAAQLSRQERLSRAHDVIDNSGSLEHLQHQVVTLHRRYSTIAHD
ncbi:MULTISPECIES: dephospho-CoA kinase [Halomonadaceae]|uniref:Dephospho-CoA kinase n=1 Tax=Vreelandella hamiltonii TaxID=502829 RepID=A0A8H9I759_9GAMM|nr:MULTISPECIES: dephospho-CoA kinase [Halomonas]ATH78942.1 dephospho-CoA kinase [Halomonas hydrothermalis]GGW22476.1 dephospho-CoA kinase [Halomonas hamiltonii]